MSSPQISRETSAPVRALVLSGGGGRGAYEAGVARACAERNFHFDWVIGTSIGALNAALVVQNDMDLLLEMWRKIRTADVYRFPDPGRLRRVIFGQQLGFLDNSPLENLLRTCVNLEKLKAASTKVGFVTTDLCNLQTRIFTSDEIDTQEDLIDILMASSAIPLFFPPRKLKGQGCWMDGGLVRNTPIQAAIQLGATEIYAVLVEPNSVDTCPTSLMQVVSRVLEIVFDHSARSGIAHVNQHNRMVELGGLFTGGNGNGNYCLIEDREHLVQLGKNEQEDLITQSAFQFVDLTGKDAIESKRVSLFIVTPARQNVGSLLEIDPVVSSWLLTLGYDDIVRKCVAVA